MDDRSPALQVLETAYRCPGHDYDIDRSVHLARLAAFYPACRDCDHRRDVRMLSAIQQRQWAEVERRKQSSAYFSNEGLEVDRAGAIDARTVPRIAAALGIVAWQTHTSTERPAVLVGSDGHWSSAELVSAACQALQWSGCGAFELGACTGASLAVAMREIEAAAALVIGNATGGRHSMSLRLWGAAARPWSSPGGLDAIRRVYDGQVDRPQRRGGTLDRASADDHYLTPLQPTLHALRPLRLVLDTTSEPFASYLRRLTERSACRILTPQALAGAPSAEPDRPFLEQPLDRLGRQVVSQSAHFGLWTSGDGERIRLVDESGAVVDDERVCHTLAAYVCREKHEAPLVIHAGASEMLRHTLLRLGAQVTAAGATRQAVFEAVESSGAVFGAGPGGQYWFAGQPTAPDALVALCLLLTIFSETDRPVSEVILPLEA